MLVCTRSTLQIVGVLFTTLLLIVAYTQLSELSTYRVRFQSSTSSSINQQTGASHNAYCIFLSEPTQMNKLGEEDVYYVSTRILIYQLLHDPETRSTSTPPVPVIIVVDTDAPNWKREQLRSDGAIVLEVKHRDFDWIKPAPGKGSHAMDKLSVFKLVEYEKILLLDPNLALAQPLDAVFSDPAGQLTRTGRDQKGIKEDEGRQPTEYIMAGTPQEGHSRLDAGFVLLRPSMDMYEHYVNVANIPGRFDGGSDEQDLWNYVHRPSGNMPWAQLDEKWMVANPTYKDYEDGKVMLREQYWNCNSDAKLKDVLLQSRWRMEGYFASLRDGVLLRT